MKKKHPESSEERIDEAISTCGEYILYAGGWLCGCCTWIIGLSSHKNDYPYYSDDDL